MRFYLDTEFNGQCGELISLALVSEWQPWDTIGGLSPHPDHGRGGKWHTYQFYCARRTKTPLKEWVREHVMPVLQIPQLSHEDFRACFLSFISCFPDCEIVCDWHADAQHFCDLLSGPTYESSLDFPCTIRILKTPPEGPLSVVPHNALEDAKALRDWHEALLRAA